MSETEAHAGLAGMLEELVRQNLERDPARRRLVTRPLRAVIDVSDAGVQATVRVADGSVRVIPSDDAAAPIRIRAGGKRVLGLASVRLWGGLPDVRTSEGRKVLGDLLTGRIRVKGLVAHLGDVRRLTALLSAR